MSDVLTPQLRESQRRKHKVDELDPSELDADQLLQEFRLAHEEAVGAYEAVATYEAEHADVLNEYKLRKDARTAANAKRERLFALWCWKMGVVHPTDPGKDMDIGKADIPDGYGWEPSFELVYDHDALWEHCLRYNPSALDIKEEHVRQLLMIVDAHKQEKYHPARPIPAQLVRTINPKKPESTMLQLHGKNGNNDEDTTAPLPASDIPF